jgi:tRNA U34 5-methylaminomethyl-2-thiouridine-forming methyltransferase MnmC
MTNSHISIVETADGSSSVYDSKHGEHFHSINGAIAESMHVFIINGLHQISASEINILEIGFGSGLNCYLTLLHRQINQKINYHAVEKYPLPEEIYSKLNYPDFLKHPEIDFNSIHTQNWNIEACLLHDFCLKKINCDVSHYTPDYLFDVIYFDAFSYNIQPEIWSLEIFKNMFNSLKAGGLLVTYSARGVVKEAMRGAGFQVSRLKGPLGKRHMLRAVKPVAAICQ